MSDVATMPDLDDAALDAIEARANAATEGPWFWRNTERGRNGNVYLQGARTRIVMAFKRLGMSGAQPMFRGRDNLLHEAANVNINDFADAAFIAHARTDVPALVTALRAEREEVAQLRHAVQTWMDYGRNRLEDAQQMKAERDAAIAEVARLRGIPEPDNHHNAYACPHCEAPIRAVEAERDAAIARAEAAEVAVAAVRALHPVLPIRLGPDAGKAMCGSCDPDVGFYPCATIRALDTGATP